MSDTPLTDSKELETFEMDQRKHDCYGWKHARNLERENRMLWGFLNTIQQENGGLPLEVDFQLKQMADFGEASQGLIARKLGNKL